MGRPTVFTEQLADTICERLLERSMVAICKDEDMPSRSTVYAWFDAYPVFRARCARAREGLVEFKLAELEDIIDRTVRGKLDPAAARVAVSHVQWMAEKLANKQYGNKLALTDPDGKPLLTDADRLARLQSLLDKAKEREEAEAAANAEPGGD